MSSSNNELIMVGGGLLLLYLVMKNSPNAVAAQQAALASSANLQSQQITANQNAANVAAVSGAVSTIANSFSNSNYEPDASY